MTQLNSVPKIKATNGAYGDVTVVIVQGSNTLRMPMSSLAAEAAKLVPSGEGVQGPAGPQGAAGPSGPPGATGPQGPPGTGGDCCACFDCIVVDMDTGEVVVDMDTGTVVYDADCCAALEAA